MKYILEKLQTDFIYATGAKYIGIMKTLGVTFASRLSEFTDKLKYVEKNRFISTAETKYLYLHGGSLVEPKVADRAEGAIAVFGSEGVVVKAGTIFVSDTIEYYAVRDAIVDENGVAVVTVKAKEAGYVANRDLGHNISFKIVLGGVNILAKVVSITGGTNDENENDFRERVKNFISHPQAPFNDNNIKHVIKQNRAIKYVWVKGGDYELGKVNIYAMDYNYALEAEDKDRAEAEVLNIKPPQLRDTDISIASPTVVDVDVVIAGVFPQASKVYQAIKDNIKEMFGEDNFEKGISKNDIERAIYAVNVEGTIVEMFTIVQGITVGAEKEVYRLNTIEVS